MRPRDIILAALAAAVLFAAVLFLTAPDGAEIFRREGCGGCHSLRSSGGGAGPDLTAASKRRSYLWMRAQIKAPKSHNPDSLMPAYGHLSEPEIYALVGHIRGGE